MPARVRNLFPVITAVGGLPSAGATDGLWCLSENLGRANTAFECGTRETRETDVSQTFRSSDPEFHIHPFRRAKLTRLPLRVVQ